MRLLPESRTPADRLDRHSLDDKGLGPIDEAEARFMRTLKSGFHFRERRQLRFFVQGRMKDARINDRTRKLARSARKRRPRFLAERFFNRLLANAADVGEPHAVSRQKRRERVNQYARHAERIGNQARVLAAGAAKTVERVAGHIVAALHRNFLDRVRHVLDRDLDEAVGDLLRSPLVANILRQRCEALTHRLGVERRVLLRTEYLRKEFGNEFSHHDVGVGHCQRTAAPIACRSGIGAR